MYADGATVYAATDGGGVGISTDGGTTFTNRTIANSGLGDNFVQGVYADGATVYAATDGGVGDLHRRRGHVHHPHHRQQRPGQQLRVRGVRHGNTVYAATNGGGLGISTDGGATFTTYTTANSGLGSNTVRGCMPTVPRCTRPPSAAGWVWGCPTPPAVSAGPVVPVVVAAMVVPVVPVVRGPVAVARVPVGLSVLPVMAVPVVSAGPVGPGLTPRV